MSAVQPTEPARGQPAGTRLTGRRGRRTDGTPSLLPVTLLLAGFAAAVGLRVAVGGAAVRTSVAGGLLFAACLVALALMGGTHLRWSARAVLVGLAGAAVLCLPVLAWQATELGAHRPGGSFLAWAAVVSVVATAEEAFLRGTLFDAVSVHSGRAAAVAVTAGCFAALHVPLYGWSSLPLNLVVGVWLGIVRIEGESATAPALAHVLADLAGWWLR